LGSSATIAHLKNTASSSSIPTEKKMIIFSRIVAVCGRIFSDIGDVGNEAWLRSLVDL
jgi:hypothetical protein